ncbi:ABC transporter substrate-binding protein [uncultured Enterovirga sp.]|uniref:ABC transporter substrate-binding protein n=1 Tax=uncultured Enterovirga sp. TaxID=2026352 RepID=UPI0035CB9C85
MRRTLGALLLSLAVAASPAMADKASNSIRFAYDQVPENVDPYFNNLRAGVIISQHVWDTLIYRDPTTGEYKGQLATKWTIVNDTTLEFDLRKGVKFHDGSDFTAEDVVYTFTYVSKPESRATTQANVNWIDKVEALDPYKVRLTTKTPFPGAIDYLSGPLVIHPAKYYEKVGPKGMNEKPVGSGPFRVSSHVIGKSLTLERNPDYFKDSPKPLAKVGKVEIRFIPDRQTQMAEIMAGGLDFIMNVPKDQADQIGAVPGYQAVSGETMRIAFLHFNALPETPTAAFKDVRVRQAINHAINKDALVKEIVGGGSRPLVTPCFFTQFGCTAEGATAYPYDPAKAKALLKEAGFGNGLSFDFYAYRERQQSEAIINDLAAIGIKANLRFLQYAAMRDQMRGGKVGFAFQTWGSNSVNDVSASTPVYFGAGSADDVSRDPEIQSFLKTGDTSVKPDDRKSAYRKAYALISERAYTVPLYTVPTYYVAPAALTFKAYPDECPRFWEMSWK